MNERLNIRRMQKPEKREEEGVSFDLDKEITESDWNEMLKHLKLYERPKPESYVELAWGVKLLDPSKLPQPSEEAWLRMQVRINEAITGRNRRWSNFANLVYTLKIPWPDKKLISSQQQKSVR